MAKKRTPFHFMTSGVEIRIDDTETRPGVMDALRALMDRLTGWPRTDSAPASPTENAAPPALTARELEIARLICEGLTSPQLMRKLTLTESTIRSHRHSIKQKVGSSDKAGLVARRHMWDK